MGNVYASSQNTNVNAPFTVTPPAPFPEPEKEASENLENPGSMEELHKKCKELFPLNFEGAKIAVQKGISNHFQISHTLNMSSITPSGYRFGATYVGTKQFSPGEAYPVLVGDIDPVGNMNANIYHRFTENLIARFQAQVQSSKFTASQFIVDYKGRNYTTSFTVCNPDIIGVSGVFVGHYLQSVSKNLDLGAELAYQRSPQLPGSQIAVTSLAARYTGSDFTLSGTLGFTGIHVCYYQKASEQLQLGVELETNFRMQEAVASIGYQIDIPKADLIFKGMLDTNWNVGATLDKKLVPMPFSLTLSGMLNHQKNQFRLGLGFVIG
uniref:Putative mitochondrial import receptor subunit tom40 isoform 1 n=1 Tax=Panstrongylus megistus TaxID=65343 RepID=A0A069DSL0_9HEMI